MMTNNEKYKGYNYKVEATIIEHVYSDPELYLNLTYNYKDDIGNIHKVTVPNIKVPLANGFNVDVYPFDYKFETAIKLTDKKLKLFTKDMEDTKGSLHENVYFLNEIIEEAKPKKLTVAEIEKELGYKIEIVSEVNKNE